MAETNNKNKYKTKGQKWSKLPPKPRLTHFLSIPLVNSVSLPQLESSLAIFKDSIPKFRRRFPKGDKRAKDEKERQKPLITDDAIRPVGTLHLTLGVMSLPTRERLDEALQFFRSLDLVAIMREAEEYAARNLAGKVRRRALPSNSENEPGISPENTIKPVAKGDLPQAESSTPNPFIISLQDLGCLPRRKEFAKVLHAFPVDRTLRLYPFCRALRTKFLEAGFLVGENDRIQKDQATNPHIEQQGEPARDQRASIKAQPFSAPTAEGSSLLEEMPTELAEEIAQQSSPPTGITPAQPTPTATGKSKPIFYPDPLLLHATIANTIYMKGEGRAFNRGKYKPAGQRYTFDASDILRHYRNHYIDNERTIPRVNDGVTTPSESETSSDSGSGNEVQRTHKRRRNDFTFVWAKDFPLETVSICEMGAKKLDPSADESGMNARLGQKYKVIEERSLYFLSVGDTES
ncbi:hypothetical protein BDV06DRAFT_85715 [Aspergillus oleicola]